MGTHISMPMAIASCSVSEGLAGRSLQEDDDRGPRSRSKRQLALVLELMADA